MKGWLRKDEFPTESSEARFRAGRKGHGVRRRRIPTVLHTSFILTLFILSFLIPVAVGLRTERAFAQPGELIFESADYDIKDGTAPTVVNGKAYLFAGEDPWTLPGTNSKVVALDASDGDLVWETELEWAGGMGSKARPLADSGWLYIGCGKSVYCLMADNGAKVWARDITPEGAGSVNSVIITDPVMYTNASGKKVVVVGDYVYGAYVGLDAADGTILWRYALDDNTSAIGAPGVDDANDRLYVPQHTSFGFPVNGKVHCLDVSGASPVKKWEYKTSYDVAGGIAVHQRKLFFSDFAYGGLRSKFYCLEDQGDSASLLWSAEVWGSSGTPLVEENSETVYFCGNDYSVGGNHFYAYDMTTGNLLWDNPNWGAYNGNCSLSPSTGYLYAGSFDTTAWAHNKGLAAMDPLTGSELWYVTSKGGGDPVVVDGVVYSTADGRLYAYREYVPSTFDWYFAEGYTGDGFDEFLCLANPGATPEDDARVEVTYIFNGGRPPETKNLQVPGGTRSTVYVNAAVGGGEEVSVKVVSDKPLVAERPVYFNYQGTANRNWTGGHCVVGADAPSKEWYFAEGYTGDGFEEYLTLANPSNQPATVQVTYLYNGEDPVTKPYTVGANSRRTLNVNQEAGAGKELGIKVNSDQPILAERPVYFNYQGTANRNWTGGHCVVGADAPSKEWYFAEGYTGDGFEEYLTLANPSNQPATVQVTYLYNGEDPVIKPYAVGANSRRTLNVNQEAGAGKELGIKVNSDRPILAERPVYFNYGGKWTGGSCVAGAKMAANFWCLAEGYTDLNFDEYICISNPGKEDAWVAGVPLFGGGEPFNLVVEAGRRQTVILHSDESVERAYALYSDRGVVVERSTYFNYQGFAASNWDGGHCTLGAAMRDIY
ncbi:outer membrane protein assembly factor BamB family protein [Candidatus Solincola sp.]